MNYCTIICDERDICLQSTRYIDCLYLVPFLKKKKTKTLIWTWFWKPAIQTLMIVESVCSWDEFIGITQVDPWLLHHQNNPTWQNTVTKHFRTQVLQHWLKENCCPVCGSLELTGCGASGTPLNSLPLPARGCIYCTNITLARSFVHRETKPK